jgi:hypothetical protein
VGGWEVGAVKIEARCLKEDGARKVDEAGPLAPEAFALAVRK